MRPTLPALLSMLLVVAVTCVALVGVIAMVHSYGTSSAIESGVGVAILLAVSWFLWRRGRRASRGTDSPTVERAIVLGVCLGMLWVVEIGVNNFLAPPLAARDILDDVFWAVIAASILGYASLQGYRTNSVVRGIEVGTWSGFVSGLFACAMALSVVVFGMRFITHDPLNVAEWAERGASSRAPGMAAYFAFETYAGALGHLLVLGLAMGALLGTAGGSLGKVLWRAVGLRRGVR